MRLGTTMSPLATWIMMFGVKVGRHFWLCIAVLAAVVLIIVLLYHFKKSIFFPRTKARVATARFASIMAMTLRGGLDIDDSLAMTERITAGTGIDKKVAAVRAAIASGKTFQEAMDKGGILSAVHRRTLAIGVRTGSADDAMEEVAERCDDEATDAVESVVGKVEPTLVIIMCVIVGVVLLSVMLPLMGVMSALG